MTTPDLSPHTLFIETILRDKKLPKTKEEALELIKVLLQKEIRPLTDLLIDKCVERLPQDQREIARTVAKGVDAVLFKICC
jgi:hypothetical protein